MNNSKIVNYMGKIIFKHGQRHNYRTGKAFNCLGPLVLRRAPEAVTKSMKMSNLKARRVKTF